MSKIKNYKILLESLDFHDSVINSITYSNDELFDKRLVVDIEYYNWEGNKEGNPYWEYKNLEITINHLVHIQINTPNLIEDSFEILDVEYDVLFDKLMEKSLQLKEQSYYKNLREKTFYNFISLKFKINNFGESIFDEDIGFIWIAGFNVSHKWKESDFAYKKHIPVEKNE